MKYLKHVYNTTTTIKAKYSQIKEYEPRPWRVYKSKDFVVILGIMCVSYKQRFSRHLGNMFHKSKDLVVI